MTTETEPEATRREAGQMLRLSARQIDRLIDSGALEATKYANGAVRVTLASVERLAAQRRPLRTGDGEAA